MATWRKPSWWSTTDHLDMASARPMLRGRDRASSGGGRGRNAATLLVVTESAMRRSRDAMCAVLARVGRRLASVLDRCTFWSMSARYFYFRVTSRANEETVLSARVVHRGRADTRELRGAVGASGRSRDRKTEGCDYPTNAVSTSVD
eukprot:2031354-Prymnesium_polylepis.1